MFPKFTESDSRPSHYLPIWIFSPGALGLLAPLANLSLAVVIAIGLTILLVAVIWYLRERDNNRRMIEVEKIRQGGGKDPG